MNINNATFRNVVVCAGTAGELIKLYPILIRLVEKKASWCFLFTGQSPINFWKQWDDFELPRSKAVTLLDTREDLKTSQQALRWFVRAILLPVQGVRTAIEKVVEEFAPSSTSFIVHGDTLSTLVGSFIAKRLKISGIAHVEAGLRSEKLFKPFPEEITRRLVSRIANVHFPQDDLAISNLNRSKVKGTVVPTGINTLYDALHDVERRFPGVEVPAGRYVVANLHRFENLNSSSRWQAMVDTLCQAAKSYPVYFVQHPPAAQKLEDDPVAKARLINAGVVLLNRQPFTSFIRMIYNAYFVISDGGSNQEECAYLGKPCLILRDTTERVEGLDGGSCLLTKFDKKMIGQFLMNPDAYKREPSSVQEAPSDLIVSYSLCQ